MDWQKKEQKIMRRSPQLTTTISARADKELRELQERTCLAKSTIVSLAINEYYKNRKEDDRD